MEWPPSEQANAEQTSKRRRTAVESSTEEDPDMQSSSSEFSYTVPKGQWKPSAATQMSQQTYHDSYEERPVQHRKAIQLVDYNEDSDQEVPLLESADHHNPEGPQITTSTTESLKHTSHTSHATGTPYRKKARTHTQRLHATTLESAHFRPKNLEPENLSKTSSRMTSKASTRQSTRSTASNEQDDSLRSLPSGQRRKPPSKG